MECTSPNFRIDENDIRFFPFDFRKNLYSRVRNKGVFLKMDEYYYFKNVHSQVSQYIQKVPCQRCIACRLNYSQQWAVRLSHELKSTEHHSYFITLTYDNDHVVFGNDINENGEIVPRPTVCVSDIQKYMKRLRDRFDTQIRFYLSAEYGDLTKRPHYHQILFNLDLPDLKFFKRNELGQPIYTSDILSDVWKNGFVSVGEVTFDSCAYVARYMMKKQKGDHASELREARKSLPKKIIQGDDVFYRYGDRYFRSDEMRFDEFRDEFCLMSRRPGIGSEWIKANFDKVYKNDEVFLNRNGELHRCKPARYYDKLFDIVDPDRMQEIKLHRDEVARRTTLEASDIVKESDRLLHVKDTQENVSQLLIRKGV